MDLGYLNALCTLVMSGGRGLLGFDTDAFIRWLLTTLQLEQLTTLEYQSYEEIRITGIGGYTIAGGLLVFKIVNVVSMSSWAN